MGFKLQHWPMLTCAWFVFTFVTTYLIATLNEHVYPFFPYISDTGTYPPESCIFGQMLNIGAVFMGVSMYIRYRQVAFAIDSNEVNLKRSWNTVAFWTGNISCLGVSMVGNFQETNILSMHLIGAIMAFGIGGIYLIIQTRISFAFRHINYKFPEYGVGRTTLCMRVFLMICYAIFFASTLICSGIVVYWYPGSVFSWWHKDRDGFQLRLAGTLSEWLLVLTFISYVFTVRKEFKSIEFEEIRFHSKCISKNDNSSSAVI